MKQYLDSSKKGAILFSLGSNLKSSLMDAEKIKLFLEVFGKLEQNVLWKFEEDLPNKPKNVMTSDWLPQSDILGKNCQQRDSFPDTNFARTLTN